MPEVDLRESLKLQRPGSIQGWFKMLSIRLDSNELACVASVSVEFGSKERPRVFGILPARKMGREPKKERWG